jgi:isopenicillin-N N-acyltransferase like protein
MLHQGRFCQRIDRQARRRRSPGAGCKLRLGHKNGAGALSAWTYGALLLAASITASHARAADPFAFAPATHGAATLERVGKIPVLVVRGTPEEMGDQLGALLAQPLEYLSSKKEALLAGFGMPALPGIALKMGTLMAAQFPANQLAELKAAAASSGMNPEFLLLANVMYDVSKIGGCSALLVEPERSATGQVLFGRNMDFPTFGFLDRCGLLVIYVPKGKHAFASVTFPGFFGCISGMNDAGLAVAELEVNQAKDGSSRFDATGVPLALCFRRVLEECGSIDEAEKLLSSIKRTSMCNLAVADSRGTAVLEITTKSVVRRKAAGGYCACTNHFRSDRLAMNTECDRYSALAEAFDRRKLSLPDVAEKLDEVNQGKLTIHSMIFEPARLRLHLALGAGPVTDQPLEEIDLAPLFGAKRATNDK